MPIKEIIMKNKNIQKTAYLITAIAFISLSAGCNWIKATFYIDHMERDSRVERMNIRLIIKKLEIKPGHSAADIGAGSGLFTRKIAEKTGPGGTVFAVDINRHLLDHIEETSTNDGIKNIKTVLAAEDDPEIPEKVDLILICDTLHYIEMLPEYVKKMSSYVKPGGRIAVIDFKANWPPGSIKYSTEDLTLWMKAAGLKPIRSYNFIEDEFFMIFRK